MRGCENPACRRDLSARRPNVRTCDVRCRKAAQRAREQSETVTEAARVSVVVPATVTVPRRPEVRWPDLVVSALAADPELAPLAGAWKGV